MGERMDGFWGRGTDGSRRRVIIVGNPPPDHMHCTGSAKGTGWAGPGWAARLLGVQGLLLAGLASGEWSTTGGAVQMERRSGAMRRAGTGWQLGAPQVRRPNSPVVGLVPARTWLGSCCLLACCWASRGCAVVRQGEVDWTGTHESLASFRGLRPKLKSFQGV